VIGTLCYQLAQFQPDIRVAVSTRIREDPKLPTSPVFSSQFNELLLQPLRSIPSLESGGPVVVIIDALDECGDVTSRRSLLDVLSTELTKLPSAFRILITSRKEPNISSALSGPNIVSRPLAAAGNDEIESFFRDSLDKTTKRFDLSPNWLNADVIPQLTRLSEGLWILGLHSHQVHLK
jgi:hypothetical protein